MILRRQLVPAAFTLAMLWAFPAFSQEPTFRPIPAKEARADADWTRTGARKTMVVKAIERVKNCVVNIHSERTASTDSAKNYQRRAGEPLCGMGTGIIIDPRGYIVTNHHVVDEVTMLRCRLADGTTQLATVVARNFVADLAIIKIDVAQPLPVMPLGTASDLMVGETVIALGNAFGYEHTASLGIISALKRDVSLNKEISYRSLIQTDASINPGNSGGPLINVHGELIGVNVAIRAGAQGIGFAIPVDNMIRTVSDMLRNRRRIHEGMVTADRLEESADGLVRVVAVEHVDKNSPADTAGVKAGDVITQVGDVVIACSYDVERALLDRKLGEKLQLVLRRQDKEQRLELALVFRDAMLQQASTADVIWTRLGMRLVPITADKMNASNKQLHGGLEVTALQSDSPASRAGIQKGDVLVGLQQWETLNLENVTFVLNHPDVPATQPMTFFILRGGQVRRGTLLQVN